jgi:hypothetical protein
MLAPFGCLSPSRTVPYWFRTFQALRGFSESVGGERHVRIHDAAEEVAHLRPRMAPLFPLAYPNAASGSAIEIDEAVELRASVRRYRSRLIGGCFDRPDRRAQRGSWMLRSITAKRAM